METQQYIVCTAMLNVIVNNTKIMNVAQNCFYGKFMSQTTIKCTCVFMESV
jgi:hypothetical protein